MSDTPAPPSEQIPSASVTYRLSPAKPVTWLQPVTWLAPVTRVIRTPAPRTTAPGGDPSASRPAVDPVGEPIYAALVRETGIGLHEPGAVAQAEPAPSGAVVPPAAAAGGG